jgi:hypothetical protein
VLGVPVEEQTMEEIEKPEEEDSDEQENEEYPTLFLNFIFCVAV